MSSESKWSSVVNDGTSQMPSIKLKVILNFKSSSICCSYEPVFSLSVCRSVCGLILIQAFGVRSSRLFVLSASRCGMFTITASSSQLETDEMPSSWRRSACFESSPSPWRRECPTWRCCGGYDITGSQTLHNISQLEHSLHFWPIKNNNKNTGHLTLVEPIGASCHNRNLPLYLLKFYYICIYLIKWISIGPELTLTMKTYIFINQF